MNMESLFPAMLVLFLGREFHRGKCEMTGSIQVWTPDLGDKLSGHFGDKFGDLEDNSKIPENAILFSISLLGEELRLNVRDYSM
ncbi:hypothetical protein AVEN_211906-1 [Araneus ventricosus]|uniref:Uncharacterized protein n=1 Tax=Araneus ventricosus TaxID=182803 RepID=A0A4Y2JI90_ARAVE|nr:hypothetical protein AVEN_211906-1 [Araneus ventricosus]